MSRTPAEFELLALKRQHKALEKTFHEVLDELIEARREIMGYESRVGYIQRSHAEVVNGLIDELEARPQDGWSPDPIKVEFVVEQKQLYGDYRQWFIDSGFTVLNWHVVDKPKPNNWSLEPADKLVVVYCIPTEAWLTKILSVLDGAFV